MKPFVGRTWGNPYVTLKSWGFRLSLILTVCASPFTVRAQQIAAADVASSTATDITSPVPQLVNYSGTLSDVNGKPLTGVAGVTFLLYKESQGGAPLWMETQNVHPDKAGHYSVMLGSTTSHGLPQDVFVNGEARWLGVQPDGQSEQSRVLLLSVPYALKAAHSETVGGASTAALNSAGPQTNGTVTGKGDVRDTLTLFPKGTDSTLAISGTSFKVDQTGKVNFVSGQNFPGTGTITGVTTPSGSGLSGGGTSGTLNLSIDSAVVPQLATANTFTNTNTVSVDSNSSPALTLANHTGNGLNISNAGTNGIYIAGNGVVMASILGDGIEVQGAAASRITAVGQNDGGYFNGRVAGSYAQNDVDGAGSAAAYGYETGSTNITVNEFNGQRGAPGQTWLAPSAPIPSVRATVPAKSSARGNSHERQPPGIDLQ